MHPASDLHMQKKELRRAMKECRALACAENPGASLALRDRFLAVIALPVNAVVAGYAAVDREIDPLPLMEALQARGCKLALPVMEGKDEALSFREWKIGDKLVRSPGRHGIPEPTATAPRVEPDVILVPMLAFDRQHNRLGRGGGYYDRTLAGLRKRRKILAIGIAFARQLVEGIPTDAHDAKLDKIVTDVEIF
jgi:5-formyltetrahydrofolate cyclo-ligase